MAFYPSTSACDLMNSQSPMPQAWIDAENRWRAQMEAQFQRGNGILDDLIATLGGNPSSDMLPGDAGVPTSGPLPIDPTNPLIAANPAALAAALADPTNGNWFTGLQLSDWQAGAAFTPTNNGVCVIPEVLPLVTVIPVPAASELPADGSPPASGISSAWLWGGAAVLGLLALAGGGRRS